MKPSPPYLGLILAASNKLDLFISRGCLPSPRSSYEYDSDADMDDEVTQALRQKPLKSSSLAIFPRYLSLIVHPPPQVLQNHRIIDLSDRAMQPTHDMNIIIVNNFRSQILL